MEDDVMESSLIWVHIVCLPTHPQARLELTTCTSQPVYNRVYHNLNRVPNRVLSETGVTFVSVPVETFSDFINSISSVCQRTG